jgi:hypothetical protein
VGGRRVLARAQPGTGTPLKNMHCCHYTKGDVKSGVLNKVTLYTAVLLKGETPNYTDGVDYGQTMWAGTALAPFYKAMLLPDYDYITDKDRTIVFDKKANEAALGPSKDYDGWNFGYQCFNGLSTISDPYTGMTYSMNTATVPTLPATNLATCLAACKTSAGVAAT